MHVSHVCCNVTAKSMVKASQLGMEALLEALSLHNANPGVTIQVSFVIATICVNGID